MKRLLTIILFLSLLISCDNKTDIKTFSDGKIKIDSYTIINADVQSSNPNKSFIVAKMDDKNHEILTYDSYGINNIDVVIKDNTIFIKGSDAQTKGLLKDKGNLPDIFGYKITLDN